MLILYKRRVNIHLCPLSEEAESSPLKMLWLRICEPTIRSDSHPLRLQPKPNYAEREPGRRTTYRTRSEKKGSAEDSVNQIEGRDCKHTGSSCGLIAGKMRTTMRGSKRESPRPERQHLAPSRFVMSWMVDRSEMRLTPSGVTELLFSKGPMNKTGERAYMLR